MALNIDEREAEKLAAEVAEMTGDTETGAVREALREKRERLEASPSGQSARKQKPRSMQEWLETEIWPHIPEDELGKPALTKAEIAEILGYGPEDA